jgi:hypothetical protein
MKASLRAGFYYIPSWFHRKIKSDYFNVFFCYQGSCIRSLKTYYSYDILSSLGINYTNLTLLSY